MNLDGPLGIVDDATETVNVAENERGAFVGGETAGKAEGECVGVEHACELRHLHGAFTQACMLLDQAATRVRDECLFALQVDAPEFLVGYFSDIVPHGGFVNVVFPIIAEIAFEERVHLRRNPRRSMHAIGDRFYRHLVHVNTRPQELPHAARDIAMQFADTVMLRPLASGRDRSCHM